MGCECPCTFLLGIPRMQSSDHSSPTSSLMVAFTVSRLEGYSNVSLWDNKQVCLQLTRKKA